MYNAINWRAVLYNTKTSDYNNIAFSTGKTFIVFPFIIANSRSSELSVYEILFEDNSNVSVVASAKARRGSAGIDLNYSVILEKGTITALTFDLKIGYLAYYTR